MRPSSGADAAVAIIEQYGSIDGDHHKTRVIDQVLRALLGDEYDDWVRERNSDQDYEPHDVGIAP